jgi:sulfur-carrier protein
VIRLVLPAPLRTLASAPDLLELDVAAPVTVASVLDAAEAALPALRGAIRDPGTGRRRPFVRFYACRDDWSNEPLDRPLPAAVASGEEPLLVVGAMSGG